MITTGTEKPRQSQSPVGSVVRRGPLSRPPHPSLNDHGLDKTALLPPRPVRRQRVGLRVRSTNAFSLVGSAPRTIYRRNSARRTPLALYANRLSANGQRRAANGFSLIEMLVVIGIILILAGILVPLVGRSWNKAKQTSMAFQMQTIATGLEAFKHDTGYYPPVIAAGTGSQVLTDAMFGPVPPSPPLTRAGLRLHPGGKVYGPYLQSDKFKISNGIPITGDKDTLGKIIPAGCLLDSVGNPILYYPAHASVTISDPNAFIDNKTTYPVTTCLYNYADNYVSSNPATYFTDIKMFQAMMGDLKDTSNNPGPDGAITGTEKAAYTGPYLLWSAGPDGLFGPMGKNGQLKSSDTPTYDDVRRSDDVTNFQR